MFSSETPILFKATFRHLQHLFEFCHHGFLTMFHDFPPKFPSFPPNSPLFPIFPEDVRSFPRGVGTPPWLCKSFEAFDRGSLALAATALQLTAYRAGEMAMRNEAGNNGGGWLGWGLYDGPKGRHFGYLKLDGRMQEGILSRKETRSPYF